MNQISVNNIINGQCTETQDTTGVRHSCPWRTLSQIFVMNILCL